MNLAATSHGNREMLHSRVGVAVLTVMAPVAALGVCVCGFDDGQFTQVTISVDGNLSDWAPVHADSDNNVCDGPANGLLDRDAPVPTTGRDLTHFAFTWDQNNVYLFTERFGSTSNAQTFVYYADTDNDGLMETGERVIGVSWQGNNGNVQVYVFDYVAQAAGGDPMVDGSGFGDGYTLPGSFANVPTGNNYSYAGRWGSGLQMEFYVTWADLGVSPGDPFTFHVSSSNASLSANNFASQVDDNLSGCGGTLGTTIVPGVDFVPDRTLGAFASQTVVAAHTLTNSGNDSDSFDFSSGSSGDFGPTAIRYYHDVDEDGVITGADSLLTDTTGDGAPNTPVLAPAESVEILIAYDVPAGVNVGDMSAVTTTAASVYQPLASDFVVDTLEVPLPPDIVVAKSASTIADPVTGTTNPFSIPGSTIRYTINVSNQGSGTVDGDSTVITDPVPAELCLVVNDYGAPGSGPVEFQDGSPASGLSYGFGGLGDPADDLEFSSDGGISFGYTPTAAGNGCDAAVTHVRINPKGTFAADTGSGAPSFELAFLAIVD